MECVPILLLLYTHAECEILHGLNIHFPFKIQINVYIEINNNK